MWSGGRWNAKSDRTLVVLVVAFLWGFEMQIERCRQAGKSWATIIESCPTGTKWVRPCLTKPSWKIIGNPISYRLTSLDYRLSLISISSAIQKWNLQKSASDYGVKIELRLVLAQFKANLPFPTPGMLLSGL